MTLQKFHAPITTPSRIDLRLKLDSIKKRPIYKAQMSVCMFVTYSSVTSVPIILKFNMIIPYIHEKVFVKKNVGEMGKKFIFSYLCSDWVEIWQGGMLHDYKIF